MLGPRIDIPVIRGRAPHDGRRRWRRNSPSEMRMLAPPMCRRWGSICRDARTWSRRSGPPRRRRWGRICRGARTWSRRSGVLPVFRCCWGRVRRWAAGGGTIVRYSTTRGALSASATGIQKIIIVVALKIVDIPQPGIVVAVRTHVVVVAAIGARSAGPSSPGTIGDGLNLRRVAALIIPRRVLTQWHSVKVEKEARKQMTPSLFPKNQMNHAFMFSYWG